jgi:hypothetical protein
VLDFFRECDVLGLRVVADSHSAFGCNFFWEEEFMQDLLGAQSDRLGASPEVIEAA